MSNCVKLKIIAKIWKVVKFSSRVQARLRKKELCTRPACTYIASLLIAALILISLLLCRNKAFQKYD